MNANLLMRFFATIGILLALFGVFVAPNFVTRGMRRRSVAIQRLYRDKSDTPWDLTDWHPVGLIDRRGPWTITEWFWSPGFKRVK
ncbi:MAG TPA: hypothetical protein ENN67_05120 [Firmicutes bacterium]|nr:hypothetical protein [Bacillota bacterium]